MKRGAIFWGTFLTSLGTFILLFRNGLLQFDWYYVRDYWAVLLILWGVSLLIKQTNYRWIFTAVIAATLGVFVASTITTHHNSNWNGRNWHFHWNDESEEFECEENDDECCTDSSRSDSTQSDSSPKTHQSIPPILDSTKKAHPIY